MWRIIGFLNKIYFVKFIYFVFYKNDLVIVMEVIVVYVSDNFLGIIIIYFR